MTEDYQLPSSSASLIAYESSGWQNEAAPSCGFETRPATSSTVLTRLSGWLSEITRKFPTSEWQVTKDIPSPPLRLVEIVRLNSACAVTEASRHTGNSQGFHGFFIFR
jgi:hypothetical protein